MLALGIDCGTSKVAAVLVDENGTPVRAVASPHRAEIPAAAGRAEQDANRILATTEALVQSLPDNQRRQVAAIGFTGQMHGVLLHDAASMPRSPLVTWQDRRLLEDSAFLSSLGRRLHAGYGLATLAWWARNGGLPKGVHAATIHGFIAARWAGLDRAPIDPTDAQAWGGLEPLPSVPSDVLPTAVGHGVRIGALSAQAAVATGLRAGIPIAAPLGDNQASLRATLTDPARELAFTVGTGCQLTAVVRRGSITDEGNSDLRPFDDEHDAVVAAPLCGGAAWLWLADTTAAWIAALGLTPPPREEIMNRLDDLGLAATDRLTIQPHLRGERHDPALSGSIQGLTLDGGGPGEIARALARGIVATARDMLPAAARTGRTCVVGSGNALRRTALLRAMTEAELGLPLVLSEHREEAATGAALVALALWRKSG